MPKILVDNISREKALEKLDLDKTGITCIIHPSSSDKNAIVVSAKYSVGTNTSAKNSWKFNLSALEKSIGDDLSSKSWEKLQEFIQNNPTQFLTAMSKQVPNLQGLHLKELQEILENKENILEVQTPILEEAKASQYKTKATLFPTASEKTSTLPPYSVMYYAKVYINEFGATKLNEKLKITGLGETQQLLNLIKTTSGYELEIGPKPGEVGEKRSVNLDEKTAQAYAENRIKVTKNFLIDNPYLSGETIENVKGSYIEKLSYLPKEIQQEVLSQKPVDQVKKMARTADDLSGKLKNSPDSASDRYQALLSVIQERLKAKVEYKR